MHALLLVQGGRHDGVQPERPALLLMLPPHFRFDSPLLFRLLLFRGSPQPLFLFFLLDAKSELLPSLRFAQLHINISKHRKKTIIPSLAVLSDSATPSNLNASNFLTGKDNIMLNPIFGMLSSRATQNIPDMLGYL